MNADYHIHTKLCKHARGEMFEYVEQAIEKGLREIAFTDHIPLPGNFDIAHRMAYHNLEGYFTEIRNLQDAYPEIHIRPGIEADFYDGFESYLADILHRYPCEVVIMSVHFIKGWGKGNWAFSYHFPDKTMTEIYSDYLQAMHRGIRTGLFNIVGHFDLIKSPDAPLLQHNRDEVISVLETAKAHNMAIELNTSGLRKQIGEIFPDPEMLPLIEQIGLPVSLASDAHEPHHVGYFFDQMKDKLAKFPKIEFADLSSQKNGVVQNQK